jgi:short-subunit dehydrogenase
MMNSETALITGASSGIGLHLASEFARNGHPLVLVAPDQAQLERIATDLVYRYGNFVRVIPKDLQKQESAREIYIELQRSGITVDILVNNAGHGFRGLASELPIDVDISMVRLNIEAVLRLTKLFLPPMIERGEGRLLNTASIAAFEPGPMLAVYHATKAFVLSWSEALATELQDSGVTVTALCPGATDTDFFPKAGMIATRAFQGQNVMSPQEVARVGYEGLMRRQLFVVPGGMNKALVAARRVLSDSAQAKMNRRFYEEMPPEKCKRRRGDVECMGTMR